MPSCLSRYLLKKGCIKILKKKPAIRRFCSSVETALVAYKDQLIRPVTKEDIERLLEIRIKRISRFDINKQQKEINEIRKNMKDIRKSLQDMVGFTITFLDKLLEKYGHQYPRLTEITSFSEVSFRKVALSNLTVLYHRKSGFMGTQIKEDEDPKEDLSVTCSEYDRLLLIFSNGLYKVIPVTEKLYVGQELEWFGIVEKEHGLQYHLSRWGGELRLCQTL